MKRSTRQRSAIRAAIEIAGRPLLPHEVLEAAQTDVPALGIATVYRNLRLLLEDGVIQVVNLPGDNPRYEPAQAAHSHHHHFQCRACDRVFDIHDCPEDVDRLAPKGFVVQAHELTLYGICADCGQPGRRSRRTQRSARPGADR